MNENLNKQSRKAEVISRLFQPKFKVRVSYWGNRYYTVDYCNFRFVPIWKSLMYWFDQGHPGGTENWSEKLFDYKTAEKIAASLSSIEDVELYHKADIEKAKAWKIAEEQFWKDNVPYKAKRF